KHYQVLDGYTVKDFAPRYLRGPIIMLSTDAYSHQTIKDPLTNRGKSVITM
ncbi:uncharacterized protein A4U43_C07F7830, partial [Asparagus officinalis]